MQKLALRTLVVLTLAATTAMPALAIVDDGSGCGCIRPCYLINR